MSWRASAVFVSGTFRDMHEERDLLAARAFPALEEQLAQHYITAATKYFRDCHRVLRHMKESGMFLDPPLVELPEQLDGGFS
jgi:hypothetical protein